MIKLLSIIFIIFILLFFLLACSVYKIPKEKVKNLLMIAFFTLIQILPIYTFQYFPEKKLVKEEFYKEEVENCMGTVKNIKLCEEFSRSATEKEFRTKFGLCLALSIFVILPISWVISWLFQSIMKLIKSKEKGFGLIKVGVKAIVSILLLTFGFLMIWGYCIPLTHVPIQIKTTSLIVVLPILLVIYVLVEAFGKAFANSGIRSHQKAAIEIVKENENRANNRVSGQN